MGKGVHLDAPGWMGEHTSYIEGAQWEGVSPFYRVKDTHTQTHTNNSSPPPWESFLNGIFSDK